MNIQEHVDLAKEWGKDTDLSPNAAGWRVTCLVLAEHVEDLTARLKAIEHYSRSRGKVALQKMAKTPMRDTLLKALGPDYDPTFRPFGCKCQSFAHKVAGDGCSECNPALAAELAAQKAEDGND